MLKESMKRQETVHTCSASHLLHFHSVKHNPGKLTALRAVAFFFLSVP